MSAEQVAQIMRKPLPVSANGTWRAVAPASCYAPTLSTWGGSKVRARSTYVVVDTYGSTAFGFLHTSKQPKAAVAVLRHDVLPFYRERARG